MQADRIWQLTPKQAAESAASPLVATAIHDGHALRDELTPLVYLTDADRLREEDPFTGAWTTVAPVQVVGTRSRFEVDLNRPREKAVYQLPEDAWGLRVWRAPLAADVVARSLAEYDTFYEMLFELYEALVRRFQYVVVFDLHTYNHRRAGPDGPAADPSGNPQVNIGTGTMPHRETFAGVLTRFQHDLRTYDFPGGPLDVRENVKFLGGNHPRWAHETFPHSVCVIAIEFKKFFMDEWSGQPDPELLAAIHAALRATVPGVLEELDKLRAAGRGT